MTPASKRDAAKQLPVIDTPARSSARVPTKTRRPDGGRRWLAAGRRALRAVALLACVAGLHSLAQRPAARHQPAALGLAQLRAFYPTADGLRPVGSQGWIEVVGADQRVQGQVATTSPEADSIVGYSGPNNVLLRVDAEQRIEGASLLQSEDTLEHVDLVRAADDFWKQFQGLEWGDPRLRQLDGVSGATLTSLAIVEAVVLRTSGQRTSLRFPSDLTLAEAQELEAAVARVKPVDAGQNAGVWEALDAAGNRLGTVYRTGPLIDSIDGYQGPTELLLLCDAQDQLLNVRLRTSFDNEPYVGYVQQEASFWSLFRGRTLAELADYDFASQGVEGVSGATMTSMAAAETLKHAAAKIVAARRAAQQAPKTVWSLAGWNWSLSEATTAFLVLFSLWWMRSSYRSKKVPRVIWQVLCLLVLGVFSGNLLSLALLAGWTASGEIPFRLAPGLACLFVTSWLCPLLLRTNVYCDQLCPHGALQQWLRPLHHRRQGNHSGRRLMIQLVRLSGGLCLLAALAWLLWRTPIPLAWLEPFDAYVWRLGLRVGLTVSLAVFAFSLALAWWQPMAYCRLACPTGKVLDLARLSVRARHDVKFDAALMTIALIIWASVWASG